MAQRLNRSLIISGLTLYSLISVPFATEGSDSPGERGSRHLGDNQNLSHLPQGAFKKEDTRDPNTESNLTAYKSNRKVSIWEAAEHRGGPAAREEFYDYIVDMYKYMGKMGSSIAKDALKFLPSLFKDVESLFCGLEKNKVDILFQRKLLNSYFQLKALTQLSSFKDLQSYGENFTKQQNCLSQIIEQVMDHQLLSAIFLIEGPQAEGFISPDSDCEKGALKVDVDLWGKFPFPLPILNYYRETIAEKDLFRIYFESRNIPLPNSSSFGSYQMSGIWASQFQPSDNSLMHQQTGFLLDKEGKLWPHEGVVVIKGGIFEDDFQAYTYKTSKVLGQKCFQTISPALPEFSLSEDVALQDLVTLAGGVKRVSKEELVFLHKLDSQTSDRLTSAQAAFLLPYVYKLKDMETDIDKGKLEHSIRTLENTLVEEKYKEIGKTAETQIERAITAEVEAEIDKKILQEDEQILQEIAQEANLHYASYNQPPKHSKAKRKWKVKCKEAKDQAIRIIKANKSGEKKIQQAEKTKQQARIKLLENIRTYYLGKTKDRKHFDSPKANEILNKLKKSFSKVGAIETGVIARRGSHRGTEMRLETSQHSVKLGQARREVKDGYKVGTLRKIINSHVDHILTLISKEKTP
ncbi:MAG: hypothetical protein K0M45_03655 [Candidatus Paracaedibacteraceae bacterium]|nr:hypothetical protein [Candidatus Paracaedibacteraceae bacterium]